MTIQERIDGFAQVGAFIQRHFANTPAENEKHLHEGLNALIHAAYVHNNWFIEPYTNLAIQNIGGWLNAGTLADFAGHTDVKNSKTVAVICAGNIPLVGFHDVLCVLLSGHRILIKLSADDQVLMPFFIKLLVHYVPSFESQILFASGKLSGFDAVIATGSNSTANHFHYYFGKYPNIIRRSRTSVALLTGNETDEELGLLADDIFLYFGLGCRNVGKLLVPEQYSFDRFFPAMLKYGHVINHNKYGNNYEYQRALYLLEKIPFLDNNFMMVTESAKLHAPAGLVYYETYPSLDAAEAWIKDHERDIQCVIGANHTPFGYSQKPVISEFADHVNTLDFLLSL